MRIGLVAPPLLPVPPPAYAGTERVVAVLGDALLARGHDVALIASGDSGFSGELIPTVDNSLWRTGYTDDPSNYIEHTIAVAWRNHDRFDVIHAHVEMLGFLFARYCPTPVVSTLHGRLDANGAPELFAEFTDIPLVAISESQRRWYPDNDWLATIHHGLPLAEMPFRAEPGAYLAFVGRIAHEKGVEDAIALAAACGLPLKMAAKVHDPAEHRLFAEVVQPAIDGGTVEFMGELEPARRDSLLAGARATLMLGAWPEPFGLVAIESLATGTPVIARRAGALIETVEHGADGYLVDDLAEAQLAVERVGDLDRPAIRQRAIWRFSVERMAIEYEAVYQEVVARRSGAPLDAGSLPTA